MSIAPLTSPTAAIDRENPWPGLASFTEEARAFFFGREKETEELVRLVRRNTLTVLFGQSGLGKSSLLQAGAFPLLREADFLPLYLRLDHSEAAPVLAEQVKAALVDAFKAVGADAPAPRADESLWEYFHRKDIDIWSAKNRLLTPVLAFDQFEEIFTLGRASEAQRERGRAFLAELADLVENRPPAALRAKFEAGELDPARYAFDKPSCQVILSLREDFLPDLEGLKNEMRSIMHSRMRVRRLNGTQALEIVTRPAPQLLAERVAERIVEFVAGARGGSAERLTELEVEPALLSVICRELNERRRTLGQPQITADLVSGNRREILTDFYERSVADLPEAMRAFVEDHLLTKSGFRDNLALETALESPGVTRPLIDTLVSRRLVRLEDRLGVQRVELTHDVLAEVIRASRDTRHQRQTLEETKQRERVTRRRMWLARTIAGALLVGLTAVSWIAWRAIRAEQEQTRLRAAADTARKRADELRAKAEEDELAAKRLAYASDLNALQRALDLDNVGRARELLNRHRPAVGEVDLRGWEWRYLWQFCQSDARGELKAGEGWVRCLAASADGTWLAAGYMAPGGVWIRNMSTKESVRIFPEMSIDAVAFSPREPLLAFAFARRAAGQPTSYGIVLWNLQSQRIERELPFEGLVRELTFSQDGQTLAVVSSVRDGGGPRECEISLWAVAERNRLATYRVGVEGGNTAFKIFATTPDLSVAAAIFGDNQVKVIDLKAGRALWSKPVAQEIAATLAISPDGTMLATGGGYTDGVIRLWDLASGKELGKLPGHRAHIGDMQFTKDGRRLLSGSGDQTLRLWDVGDRALLRTYRGHQTEVLRLVLLPDQRTLASGAKDGSVLLWDLESERAPSATGMLDPKQRAWAFADGGRALVTVDAAGEVVRWHGRTFREKETVLSLGEATGLVIDGNRARLAVATADNRIRVWDWSSRMLVREFPSSADVRQVQPALFSPDGSMLAVRVAAAGKKPLQAWEIATGREVGGLALATSSGPTGPYAGFRGRELFGLGRSGNVTRIWRWDQPPAEITHKGGVIRRPAFSPDGRILAVPNLNGYVELFDGSTLQPAATLAGYMHGVHSLGFSADGSRLVTGGTATEAITVWDLLSRERLLTLPAREDQIVRTELSPDGNVLVAQCGRGSNPGALYFWRAPSWAEIEKAEAAERAGAGR